VGKKIFIIKRIIQMLITLFLLVTIVFLMFRLLPGDPLAMYINTDMPVEVQKALMHRFGLDKPLHEQYLLYLKNLLAGDFGQSFHYGQAVISLVAERFWNTIILMGIGIGLAYVMGCILGALAAWKRGSKFEVISIIFTLSIRSAPLFWIGIILIMIFGMWLNLLPLGGIREVGIRITSTFGKFLSLDFLLHMILPATTLAFYYMGTPFLIMRSAMLEVMNEEFIEIVKAKGLKTWQVIFKHAMRNSLLPVITMLTVMISFIMGGQVMLETIFRWPGIGMEIVSAVNTRDYPMAQALFIMMGIIILIVNFVVDLLYHYLDPRVTYE
jgi:peptide/nickel transport system permease protein